MNLKSEDLLKIAKNISDQSRRETVIQRAVDAAVKEYGCNSLMVGLALMDLADCLSAQNKKAEEVATQKRASFILANFMKSHPDYFSEAAKHEPFQHHHVVKTSGTLPTPQ